LFPVWEIGVTGDLKAAEADASVGQKRDAQGEW
jgi:hypothetical protein